MSKSTSKTKESMQENNSGTRELRTSFHPVEQQRAFDYVAEQIRRHIALRLFLPGSALPSERELVQIFGVGRPTVQLALRSLEAEGLITSRRGASGGTFVSKSVHEGAPTQDLKARIIRKMDDIRDLLVSRKVLEPAVAAAAAEYRDEKDISALERAHEAICSSTVEAQYMRFDTEFHVIMAGATGSAYLKKTMENLRIGLNDVLALLPESDVWHARINAEHQAIMDAIKNQDRAEAARLVDEHAEHSDQSIRSVLAALQRASFLIE